MGGELTWIRLGECVSVQQVSEKQEKKWNRRETNWTALSCLQRDTKNRIRINPLTDPDTLFSHNHPLARLTKAISSTNWVGNIKQTIKSSLKWSPFIFQTQRTENISGEDPFLPFCIPWELPSNLHGTPVISLSGRDKCTKKSYHRANARHRSAAAWRSSSEEMKYECSGEELQLRKTWEERSSGAAPGQRREPLPATSAVALCFSPVSFPHSVQVSGGGAQEDRDAADNTPED